MPQLRCEDGCEGWRTEMTDEAKLIVTTLRAMDEWYMQKLPKSYLAQTRLMEQAADLIEKMSLEQDSVKAEPALETAEKTDREKLLNLLAVYFNIGNSYEYSLTRTKEAFGLGTMTFEDFAEFDDAKVAEIADYLIDHGVMVVRRGPCEENGGADGRGQMYFMQQQATTRQHDMISCETCRLYGKCGREQADGLECCVDWERAEVGLPVSIVDVIGKAVL